MADTAPSFGYPKFSLSEPRFDQVSIICQIEKIPIAFILRSLDVLVEFDQ